MSTCAAAERSFMFVNCRPGAFGGGEGSGGAAAGARGRARRRPPRRLDVGVRRPHRSPAQVLRGPEINDTVDESSARACASHDCAHRLVAYPCLAHATPGTQGAKRGDSVYAQQLHRFLQASGRHGVGGGQRHARPGAAVPRAEAAHGPPLPFRAGHLSEGGHHPPGAGATLQRCHQPPPRTVRRRLRQAASACISRHACLACC